jgi:thymidylate synthase
MFQRSGDVPIGIPSNLVQYSALTLMLAQVTGYEAYEFVHTISDAHIYVDQVPAVEEMFKREPRPLPFMRIKDSAKHITNIFEFTKDDFELVDYNPHPGIKNIPVAI